MSGIRPCCVIPSDSVREVPHGLRASPARSGRRATGEANRRGRAVVSVLIYGCARLHPSSGRSQAPASVSTPQYPRRSGPLDFPPLSLRVMRSLRMRSLNGSSPVSVLTFGCARLLVGASPRAAPALPLHSLSRGSGRNAAPSRRGTEEASRCECEVGRPRDRAGQSPRQSVAPPTPKHYSPRHSERSAARLAHQSGGLGVPSSNLGAPTTN
jgi:hypothetical protein